jgi:peroxiredoxin
VAKLSKTELLLNINTATIQTKMSAISSTMLKLGTRGLDFNLVDVSSGETISLDTFKDKKGLLIMFICRHCPFVKHIQQEIARVGNDYKDKDLGILAISSNDIETYPEDAPDSLKEMAQEQGFSFPFCFDETQKVAKNYTAVCTPDFFLFDIDRKLVYRGQLDDSRPGNEIPVTGKDLREAIDALLEDKPINSSQKPSIGCSIKWHPGNEPV